MIQLLVAYLAKALVILLVAALLTRAIGASAETRHRVWTLAFAAAILVLPASWLLPPLHLGLRPNGAAGMALSAVILLWAVVAILLLVRIALDQLALARLRRDAAPVTDGAVLAAARAAKAEMKVSRAVQVRHWTGSMPATFGMLRPVILLPAGAPGWPAERLRLTLMHELGHVARRDAGGLLLSRIAAAIHWCNPLCLWAYREARTTCEYACDDLVLRSGAAARDYARTLIDTARDCAAGDARVRAGVLTLTPARGLEARVTRVFGRRAGRERKLLFAIAATALLVVGGVLAPARIETAAPWSYGG